MASKIEDYALLSNMRSGPLVSRHGSVDWWCVPRFDSPALFAALLGTPDHGRWLLAPYCAVNDDAAVDLSLPGVTAVERFYAENTFVLHTVWTTDTGTVRVTDFMPLNSRTELIRRVEGLTGEVEMFQDLRLRFNYGSSVPWLSRFDVLEEESEEGAVAESVLVGMAGPIPWCSTVTRCRRRTRTAASGAMRAPSRWPQARPGTSRSRGSRPTASRRKRWTSTRPSRPR